MKQQSDRQAMRVMHDPKAKTLINRLHHFYPSTDLPNIRQASDQSQRLFLGQVTEANDIDLGKLSLDAKPTQEEGEHASHRHALPKGLKFKKNMISMSNVKQVMEATDLGSEEVKDVSLIIKMKDVANVHNNVVKNHILPADLAMEEEPQALFDLLSGLPEEALNVIGVQSSPQKEPKGQSFIMSNTST